MEQQLSFVERIKGDKPVLVDFFATWCGPCKMMQPILQEVAKELNNSASILKVDVDRNPTLAQHYQIQGVPTLILFKQGNIVWRQSGVVPAHQLLGVIHQHV
ncbi:MAG: thioredoxin [Cyclobacteriaceae bacterium]|jgi:thioredoxin 1|nr:thioredoxin [Cyclobacteriaceae bacterium]